MTGRKAVRGITWIEFSVALCLISVFATVLLAKLLQVELQAEQTMFDVTVSNIKSGLRWKKAELMMRNRLQEMGGLAGINPVVLLDRQPQGYMGETDSVDDNAGGVWYFDRSRRELIYRFRRWNDWPFALSSWNEGRLSIQAHARSTDAQRTEGIEVIVQLTR